MGRVSGKIAVVTGGSNGIGEGIVRRLAAEDASVVIADIDVENGERVATQTARGGGRAEFIRTDLGDEASIDALFEQVDRRHGGRVDVLVNNAGATHLARRDFDLLSTGLDVWHETMAINVMGAVIASRHAVARMVRSEGGSLIHMSSAASCRGEDLHTAYAVSKAGLNALSMQIATQYGSKGVRSNVILPGVIVTEASRTRRDDFAREAMQGATMVNRLGVASDIAAAVLFLASDEASFVTGTEVPVDGGLLTAMTWVPAFRRRR